MDLNKKPVLAILIVTIFLFCFLLSCRKDKTIFNPAESDYHAILNINGQDIRCWISASVNSADVFGISFTHYIDGLTYPLGMTVRPPSLLGGYYRLHSYYNDTTVSTQYAEMCCYEIPDQPNKKYYIYESDSMNNYLQLHLDTITQEASGMFKGTYINHASPYDLLHIRCDTFYCKYMTN